MKLERYKQNKVVEIPTGVKVRHRYDHYKKVYVLTVAMPQKTI